MREVWRSQTCTSGSPFFCFEPVFIIRANRFCVIKAIVWMMNAGSHFGEAKKSKCPVGMKRMVKATHQAHHKASTQLSGCLAMLKRGRNHLGSLKRHPAPLRLACKPCASLNKRQPENASTHFQAALNRTKTAHKKNGVNKPTFTPKHTHQEENNLEVSQNNNLRCPCDGKDYGGCA